MLEKLKQSWQRFQTVSPGHRFQRQFSRRQQSGHSPVQKALFIGGGILLMVAGLFFLFLPGPGLLIVILGAVLIAQRSLLAARTLDWTEIHVRELMSWSLRAWHHLSPVLKVLLVVLALAVVAAVGFGAFTFLIANMTWGI